MRPIPTQERPARHTDPSASKGEPLPIGAPAVSGRCQVRNGTDSPCGRPAAVTELLGIPFCGHCAREQEDDFVIGELTRAPRGRRAGTAILGHAVPAAPRRPQAPAERRRRYRETVATGAGKVPFLLVVLVLASVLASAACGGPEQARADSDAANPQAEQEREAKERPQAAKAIARGNAADRAVARAGDAEARAGDAGAARAGDAKAGTGDAQALSGSTVVVGNVGKDAPDGNFEGKDDPEKVTLRITGDPETRFSGTCSVGVQERALNGQAPERYAFKPDGKKLECELRKEGGGGLGIVFADGEGMRSEQRTGAGQSTVGFVYSGGSIASSTSSSVSVQRAVTSSGGTSSDGSR